LCNEIGDGIRWNEDALKTWGDFETRVADMGGWIGEAEASLKAFTPKDTLEEKEADLVTFKVETQQF